MLKVVLFLILFRVILKIFYSKRGSRVYWQDRMDVHKD